MPSIACVSALAVVVAFAGPVAQESDPLGKIVASYLAIQAGLADDKTDGVKESAAAIAEQAAAMGEPGAAIAKAAKGLEAAGDLKAARDAFEPLSKAVIEAAKAANWQGLDDVKLAFCPMVNAQWLQKGDAIRNPYYGSQMLTCGSFVDR